MSLPKQRSWHFRKSMSVLFKVLPSTHHHFVLQVLGKKRWECRGHLHKQGSRSKQASVILFILFVVLGSSPGLTYARQMLGCYTPHQAFLILFNTLDRGNMKDCTFHFTLGLKVPHCEHETDQLSHENSPATSKSEWWASHPWLSRGETREMAKYNQQRSESEHSM